MRIVIATNNAGKLREFKSMLTPLGYEAVSLAEANVTVNVTEDGQTFEENARKKAREIQKLVKCPVIADDSGLVIDYLDGEPGIYSARYGGENLSDNDRNSIILENMANAPIMQRSASFISVICYKDENREFCVEGTVKGFIGKEPLGKGGFGYDPIFMIDEEKSMAMLSDAEKNRISHRGNALRKLVEKIRRLIEEEY